MNARRKIVASEAASKAAESAVKALKELNYESDEKSWYRLLPKPSSWEPKSREEEITMWRDWVWSLEQRL